MNLQSFKAAASAPLLAGLITTTAASATPITVIDFDQFEGAPNAFVIFLGPELEVDGVSIRVSDPANEELIGTGRVSAISQGSTSIFIDSAFEGGEIIVDRDGLPFDLESIDIFAFAGAAIPSLDEFSIAGVTADGSEVLSDPFDVSNQLSTFNLGSNFDNVVSVRLPGGRPGVAASFDNLVINEAATTVPEPSTLAVGALGLALLYSRTPGRT